MASMISGPTLKTPYRATARCYRDISSPSRRRTRLNRWMARRMAACRKPRLHRLQRQRRRLRLFPTHTALEVSCLWLRPRPMLASSTPEPPTESQARPRCHPRPPSKATARPSNLRRLLSVTTPCFYMAPLVPFPLLPLRSRRDGRGRERLRCSKQKWRARAASRRTLLTIWSM